jgi:OmpA-OmpF porin, OOP family
MAVNVLTYLKDQFGPTVIEQLSTQLGEIPANVRVAVNGALPVVLGALAQQAQSGSWTAGLLKTLHSEVHSVTENPLDIGQVTDTQAETQTAFATGRGFLERVLGSNTGAVADGLSRFSGIKPDSAMTVLGLGGSALMGLLARQTKVNGMTTDNLQTLLAGQADTIRQALPPGLTSVGALLGLDKLQTPTGKLAGQGLTNFSGTPLNPDIPKSPEADRVRENNRFLIPILIAVGLLVMALLLEKCREPQTSTAGILTDTTKAVEPDAVEDTSAATKQAIKESGGSMMDTVGVLGMKKPATAEGSETKVSSETATAETTPEVQLTLPGGRKIGVGQNMFNYNIATFLAGKPKDLNRTFTFDNLTFDTGSARITARSQPNVTDLMEVMRAYPTLNIRIEGHTDNTGDAAKNQKLSADRAAAVKAALVTQGISAGRINTQGFGADKPAAPNNTDAGRQKNRRIDVVITKL